MPDFPIIQYATIIILTRLTILTKPAVAIILSIVIFFLFEKVAKAIDGGFATVVG